MTGLLLLIGFAMGLIGLLTLPGWVLGAFLGIGALVVGTVALLLGANGLSDTPSPWDHY